MATAVLDIGKSNLKLVVVDEAGRTLWTARAPNRALPGPPYPHLDTDAIWAFALQSLREAGTRAPIEAIVTAAHGATAALVDDGELVLPVLDYEHPAPATEDHGYADVRPPFSEILSPNLENGINVGRQVHWQSRRFPEAFARTRHILTYPQFWSWRLSGVAASETTSLGAHSDLWEPRGGRFSHLVERCGWSHLFPPVRPAHAVLGPITAEVAAATGLKADCKVICGIHDSNASLTPHLLTRPSPFTVVSTGTWVIIMAIGATVELDEGRDTFSNVNVLGDAVPTARFMGGRDHEILVPPGSPPASEADVAAVLASGCVALPCFSGPSGPFSRSRGRIEGDLPATPGARAALAALFLALMTDQCLDIIGAAGDTIVEGGFSANRAYLSVLAALRPHGRLLASTDATGTALGAAMLARWEGPHAAPAAEPVAPGTWPGLDAYRQAWLARLRDG